MHAFQVTAIHVQLAAAPHTYGPRLAKGEPRRCRNPRCRRRIPAEARRHECARCAVTATRGRSVDAPCAVCGNDDLRVLGWTELVSGPVILCANDRTVLGRLALTLDELRVEVALVARPGAAGLLDELLLELDTAA